MALNVLEKLFYNVIYLVAGVYIIWHDNFFRETQRPTHAG